MSGGKQRLLRRGPSVQLAVFVPDPLSGRLDAILAVADEHGEPTSRREMVAALIFEALFETEMLDAKLAAYRQAAVKDAFVSGQPEELITSPTRRPGPRSGTEFAFVPELLIEPAAADAKVDAAPQLTSLPSHRIGLALPHRLAEALDRLASLSGDRDELLAALILDAPDDPDELLDLVSEYRRASESDVPSELAGEIQTAKVRRPSTRRRQYRRNNPY